MEQFEKLCDEFNIEPSSEEVVQDAITPEAIQKLRESETAEMTDADEDKVVEYKGQKYSLKHLKFLESQWQEKIVADGDVLEVLRQMCKVGAAPRYFEVYSSLSNTQAAHLKELGQLNKVITDYRVTEEKENMQREAMAQRERLTALKHEGKGGDTYIQNNTLTLTSTELAEMLENAKTEAKKFSDNIIPEFNLD